MSLAGGGPDLPPDDEDEDDDDDEDEEDEEEEDDNRTRRGRRRLRDDREIKNERPRISRKEAERVSIPNWPKIHQRHQQGVIVKGRELVALVMQAFRTPDRTDLVYHIEHLFNLDFPGDKNLVLFRNKWLLKMRSEDRPSPLALRDILYRKIKGSKKMEFGLNAYTGYRTNILKSRTNSCRH